MSTRRRPSCGSAVARELREAPATRLAPLVLGGLGLWILDKGATGLGLLALVFAVGLVLALVLELFAPALERRAPAWWHQMRGEDPAKYRSTEK